MRDHPEIASVVRVIDSLGPSTIQPVAVSKRFDEAFRTAVADALIGLHLDPMIREILDYGLIDHFSRVGPHDYDDIRDMLEACERAEFLVLA